MTTETHIKPALTLEEWENARVWIGDMEWDYAKSELGGFSMQGIAALALHDQPFGFTWEDVDTIRAVADDWYTVKPGDECCDNCHLANEHGDKFRALADRIAALLPPRQAAPESTE